MAPALIQDLLPEPAGVQRWGCWCLAQPKSWPLHLVVCPGVVVRMHEKLPGKTRQLWSCIFSMGSGKMGTEMKDEGIFGYADMLSLLGGGFKYFNYCIFSIFTPIWGRFPFWVILSIGLKPSPRLNLSPRHLAQETHELYLPNRWGRLQRPNLSEDNFAERATCQIGKKPWLGMLCSIFLHNMRDEMWGEVLKFQISDFESFQFLSLHPYTWCDTWGFRSLVNKLRTWRYHPPLEFQWMLMEYSTLLGTITYPLPVWYFWLDDFPNFPVWWVLLVSWRVCWNAWNY